MKIQYSILISILFSINQFVNLKTWSPSVPTGQWETQCRFSVRVAPTLFLIHLYWNSVARSIPATYSGSHVNRMPLMRSSNLLMRGYKVFQPLVHKPHLQKSSPDSENFNIWIRMSHKHSLLFLNILSLQWYST